MLFPKSTFRVNLPSGVIWAGKRVDGTLEIDVPEPIPRADHVELHYVVSSWAGYGSGKSRQVVRRTIFAVPLEVRLPAHVLPAGTHRYPFVLDVPAWLPPPYTGNDCGIEHKIQTRVDVDWAIDPKAEVQPAIVMAPREGVRTPVVVRSPAGFHDPIVLEVTLASAVFAQDEAVSGQVALRGGHGARFDGVVVSLVNVASIKAQRGDRRRGGGIQTRLDGVAIRTGEPVPFVFPPDVRVVPTFRNAFMDNDAILVVRVDIPWGSDPELTIPLDVLPAGSRLFGDASLNAVGGARLRLSAQAMAQKTGLSEGRAPVLLEGPVGPVRLRVEDAPREGKIGVDVELAFPDVELGTSFRPLGMLDGFRESKLLPEKLRDRYLLRARATEPARELDDRTLAAFYEALTAGFENATDLRVSDQHVAAHFALQDDDGARMVALAVFLRERAQAIGEGISRLPFPAGFASSRATWQAVAVEQGGFVVPTGPALHGLSFGAQLFDGSARVLGVTIRTTGPRAAPRTEVDVALRGATVPESAAAELESGIGGELVRAIHETFSEAHVRADLATLTKEGFTADPRTLFAGIEAFLSWLLDVRGERRTTSPYR